jgi:signal transduction histidine kinase
MMQRRSFIRRLIGGQIAAMGVIWAALIACLFFVMNRYENGDLDRRMGYFATILAETAAAVHKDPEQLSERIGAVERVYVEGIIETLDNARNYTATFQVIDQNNHVVYHAGPATTIPWPARAGFGEVVLNGTHFHTIVTQSVDRTISVMVAESDATRWSSVWPMLRIIGASQLVIFAMCIGALGWAGRRGIRPIEDMATAVAAKRPGDLQPIDDQLGYKETAPLVAAFNDLLAREARRLDAERGFPADAAHELRTPIAALTASAHQVVAANDDAARRVAAIRLDQGAARISHLLSQLLMTARADSSPAFATLETIDAAELLRQRLAALVPAARRKGISLSLDAPESAAIEANVLAFDSIVENLVDNAIRYTPQGGSVLVTLSKAGRSVELNIKDSGPGIAPELYNAVFERFFRIPGSDAQGSGLGLAIVRRLAQALGSSVHLGPGLDGRGLSVALSLRSAGGTG